MVIKNPPKISPGLIFGMIFVLRIRGAYFRGGGGGLIIGILRILSLIRPKAKNTFGVHDSLGLRFESSKKPQDTIILLIPLLGFVSVIKIEDTSHFFI